MLSTRSETLTEHETKGELTASDDAFGLFTQSLGVGVGYAPTRELVLGARIQQGRYTDTIQGASTSRGSSSFVSLLPYVEHAIALNSSVHPFLGASIGVEHAVFEQQGSETLKRRSLVIGGSVGVRLFGGDSFSVDPALTLRIGTGTERNGDYEFDTTSVAVLLGFGLSGWLGGSPSGPPSPPAVPVAPIASPVPRNEQPPASSPARGDDPAPREEAGVLTSELALDGVALTLLGKPRAGDTRVAVRAKTSYRSLEGCHEASLWLDERRYSLVEVETTAFVEVTHSLLLRGYLDVNVLAELGEASTRVKLQLCGAMFDVPSEARARIRAYYEHFRDIAREASTTVPPGERHEAPQNPAGAAPATPPPAAPAVPRAP